MHEQARDDAPRANLRKLTAGVITGLDLINADKDSKILTLTNGTVVLVKDIPGMTTPAFNINVTYNGTFSSISFRYNNSDFRTEEAEPFAFCGNDRSNFYVCDKLGCGNHTVSAVPAGGAPAWTVSFSIVCPSPTAPVAVAPVVVPPAAPLAPMAPVVAPVAPVVAPVPPTAPTTFAGSITGLDLINADKDSKILTLTNGTTIVVKDIPGMTSPAFNINATFNGAVRSAVYLYNSSQYRTENVAPFAFCGNDRSNFYVCDKLGCGNHTVSVVPHASGSGQGATGPLFTVSFSIVCPPGAPVAPSAPIVAPRAPVAPVPSPTAPTGPVGIIVGLDLINADKDTKVLTLVNGTVVIVRDIPGMTTPSFNINGIYNGAVLSAKYWYGDTKYRLEEVAPFAFCGNSGTNFYKCDKLGCGNHTVSLVPYSGDYAQGTIGKPYSVSFSIVCASPAR